MSNSDLIWDDMTYEQQLETIVLLLQQHEIEAADPGWFTEHMYASKDSKVAGAVKYVEKVIELENLGLIPDIQELRDYAAKLVHLPSLERARATLDYAQKAAARHIDVKP